MRRRLQFGMRENPASDRRHDSRLPMNDPADTTIVSKAETGNRAHHKVPIKATLVPMACNMQRNTTRP